MDEIELIENITETLVDHLEDENFDIKTFHEAGLLTTDNGLVVSFKDGPEFQVTVKRSR